MSEHIIANIDCKGASFTPLALKRFPFIYKILFKVDDELWDLEWSLESLADFEHPEDNAGIFELEYLHIYMFFIYVSVLQLTMDFLRDAYRRTFYHCTCRLLR